MYSDTLERFINVDPAEEGMNWYESRADNPINGTDPTGLYLVAFDGTWDQEQPGKVGMGNNGRDTIIVQFKNHYTAGVASYEPGTGNNKTNGTLGVLAGGALGSDGTSMVNKEYRALVAYFNAHKDDRNIDIVGYSRGGFLALALAQMINDKGIPDTSTGKQTTVTRTVGKQTVSQTVTTYCKTFSPKIRFLGLVDPVAQFNLPFTPLATAGWPTQIPPNVESATLLWANDNNSALYKHVYIGVTPGSATDETVVGYNDDHPGIGGDSAAYAQLIASATVAGANFH